MQVCMLDVDSSEAARAMRQHGFKATYIGLEPESSETMLRNIQDHLTEFPLPGYEPEDAAAFMLKACPSCCGLLTTKHVYMGHFGHCVPMF